MVSVEAAVAVAVPRWISGLKADGDTHAQFSAFAIAVKAKAQANQVWMAGPGFQRRAVISASKKAKLEEDVEEADDVSWWSVPSQAWCYQSCKARWWKQMNLVWCKMFFWIGRRLHERSPHDLKRSAFQPNLVQTMMITFGIRLVFLFPLFLAVLVVPTTSSNEMVQKRI